MNEEQRWIAAARNGDQESFEKLVRLYEKRVFSLTSRMCRNSADAEEAAQEAFLAAWQALPAFRGDASFATWLYRLVSNACVDILRREGRHQVMAGPSLDDEESSPEPPDKSPSPHALAERAELRRQIEAGLAALPPEYRQVLILREIHQCTYDEIAQICSIDLGTVKSRINRGRKRLRKILLESGNFSAAGASKKTEKEGCR
ncbi:sigma-70 family RNA polymerase sigma factor [Dysosmobacter sp. NSJ-60]|uniref:RNA polymerase subunit sigma-24 n=1 Tax=Pusillibacter faecalis TaxID=2714358 RepID=A0A810QFH8_9FIRM|nr:sigma-70 family RNA polymerase sigma factor [Pusillibacter faecalis]MBC5747462.1 sigma-70 family RNA polymerase sigma factor [Dysosmobacter hominis]MBS5657687.1 sigma-70 family RNA polymerase sigma factor [Oscillibacter sp.]BCK84852.1 RNA polymerase subunit sigma-24 [Pusillibacter faecalis]